MSIKKNLKALQAHFLPKLYQRDHKNGQLLSLADLVICSELMTLNRVGYDLKSKFPLVVDYLNSVDQSFPGVLDWAREDVKPVCEQEGLEFYLDQNYAQSAKL
jgi:glutathione S-transferase